MRMRDYVRMPGVDESTTLVLPRRRRKQQLRVALAALVILFTLLGIFTGMALVRLLSA